MQVSDRPPRQLRAQQLDDQDLLRPRVSTPARGSVVAGARNDQVNDTQREINVASPSPRARDDSPRPRTIDALGGPTPRSLPHGAMTIANSMTTIRPSSCWVCATPATTQNTRAAPSCPTSHSRPPGACPSTGPASLTIATSATRGARLASRTHGSTRCSSTAHIGRRSSSSATRCLRPTWRQDRRPASSNTIRSVPTPLRNMASRD